MPDFRRVYVRGGMYFFTIVTENRAPIFTADVARKILHDTIEECRNTRPFEIEAMVLLPDHLHSMWTLPEGDCDYSTRWAFIKSNFTRRWIQAGGQEQSRTGSRIAHRRRGVWQRRFWEHLVSDNRDLEAHFDYLHYNPVKHGYVQCAHAWPHSTFGKWVKRSVYDRSWMCSCGGRTVQPPDFRRMSVEQMECGE